MGVQNHLENRSIGHGKNARETDVKYSICITNYNTEDTIQASISSILSQIDDNYQIVIVDNKSTDASPAIAQDSLKKAACKFAFISERCSRGRGRQLAFENSVGEYILDQMDMDDVLIPRAIPAAVYLYHKYYEGILIYDVGGWEDLQHMEDRLLWWRMAQIGKFVIIPFELRSYIDPSQSTFGKRRMQERIVNAYGTFRDAFRERQNLLLHLPITPKWFAMVPLAFAAYVRTLNMKKFERVPLLSEGWTNTYKKSEHMPELV